MRKWIQGTYLKFFLGLWALTALGASAIHLWVPRYLVSLTSWQYARNWQMEIAFFDISLSALIAYALISQKQELQRNIAYVLGFLAIFLGTNHFGGYSIDGRPLHLTFAMLNLVAVFSALAIAMASRGLPHESEIELLRTLEESLWKSETRFNLDHQERVFAHDFFEFGRSGRIYTRSELIRTQSQPIVAKLPLQNFQVRFIDLNTVLVTYMSEVQYETLERANRSSIWSKTPTGWQLRFHQGTAT